MFKMIKTGPTRSDCSAPYDVILDKEYTVREFIETVLKENSGEWGEVYYHTNKDISVFDSPKCTYRYGKLISEPLPEEYLNKTIKKVIADGGWTNMDYLIKEAE